MSRSFRDGTLGLNARRHRLALEREPTGKLITRAFSYSVAGLARCTNVLSQPRKVQRLSLSTRCCTIIPTGWNEIACRVKRKHNVSRLVFSFALLVQPWRSLFALNCNKQNVVLSLNCALKQSFPCQVNNETTNACPALCCQGGPTQDSGPTLNPNIHNVTVVYWRAVVICHMLRPTRPQTLHLILAKNAEKVWRRKLSWQTQSAVNNRCLEKLI